jgi:hypothetical protein
MAINGAVYAGPGANVNTAIIVEYNEGDVAIRDGTGTLSKTVEMPEVTIPNNLPVQTHLGNYSGSQGDATLQPGDYRSSGALNLSSVTNLILKGPGTFVFSSITMTGNTDIKVDVSDGPVKIISDGNISIDKGGFHTYHKDRAPVPSDLSVKGTNNCTNVTLAGLSSSYHTVYTPNAQIKISTTPAYGGILIGAIAGKDILVENGFTVYYDKQLQNTNIGVTVVSWQVF